MKVTTAVAKRAAVYLDQHGWAGFAKDHHDARELRRNIEQLRRAIELALSSEG